MLPLILPDLLADLPDGVRLQRLARVMQTYYQCHAVGLLSLDNDALRLVAASGLPREALGRRFLPAEHPRLAAILAQRGVVWFGAGHPLPDPYDGLMGDEPQPSPVHDCMGMSLYVAGRLWGAVTLDAVRPRNFTENARQALQHAAPLLETAVRVSLLEAENRRLRQLGSNPQGISQMVDESEILGSSAPIEALLRELEVVAESSLPVLLLGETGVGKELFARRLHRNSRRADRPLVHVNCAALPESLAESELFGHVKGAFSGASSDRPGRFEAASGGTLFLDEVGELPLAIQAKLLRALQNGEIQRLGADKVIQTDVRVIAATNRDLKEYTLAGHFRADLYHRLSVYPVRIPPLRERGDDVLLLAGHFLEFNRTRLGVRGLRLSRASEQALLRYHWPGNVRELEHVVSRAALKSLSRGGSRDQILTLGPELLDLDVEMPMQDLPHPPTHHEVDDLYALSPSPLAGIPNSAPETELPCLPLRQQIEDCQRAAIQQALTVTHHHWARAARQLQVDPSNLRKLASRLGLR